MLLPNPGVLAAGNDAFDPYGGASIVLDFAGVKNGGSPFYKRDGVVYASAAAAGFTGTGTFGANGYTATGTQFISGTVSVSSDFIILADFVDPANAGNKRIWQIPGTVPYVVGRSSTAFLTVPSITAPPASSSRIAFGRAGGAAKASYDGQPVSIGPAADAPTGTTLYIGNQSTPNVPWTVPIRLIEVHVGTLTDAQIQNLCVF